MQMAGQEATQGRTIARTTAPKFVSSASLFFFSLMLEAGFCSWAVPAVGEAVALCFLPLLAVTSRPYIREHVHESGFLSPQISLGALVCCQNPALCQVWPQASSQNANSLSSFASCIVIQGFVLADGLSVYEPVFIAILVVSRPKPRLANFALLFPSVRRM